jgi:3D (Asp-Asp-Asp) domain-containing protein
MHANAMSGDWGSAIVVDPKELRRLRTDVARFAASSQWLRIGIYFFLAACTLSASTAYWQSRRATRLAKELNETRRSAQRSHVALAALARSHEGILAATEQAPSVGTKSWGRRFVVTKYIPRSPKYGKFNDGFTSTMTKADPDARIVAVDPKLIPYKSWVWIEDLGWYHAEDCGSAIKGFRLDLLTATEEDAMTFGKQSRFVIVVPPTDA